jgi:hypothetical protein
MTTSTENKYELATPISFGTTLGLAVGAFMAPAAGIGGFVVGAMLGFWFDKKERNSRKSSEASAENKSAKQSVIGCNH